MEHWGRETEWMNDAHPLLGEEGAYEFSFYHDNEMPDFFAIFAKLETLGFRITAYYFLPYADLCGKWENDENNEYPTGEKWERREVPEDIAAFCHDGEGWAFLYDDEDEEEPVRKALYKGGAVALAAYRALDANNACCGICQVTREEHEAEEREEAPPVAVAMGGGGGGGAEAPPGEPAVCMCGADFIKTARARKCPPCTEAVAVKALFVVPLCETHVATWRTSTTASASRSG